jgi:acyl carrier protein
VLCEIEARFGIEITDAEAARCMRVGDLLDCVMTRLDAGQTAKAERQQWTRPQVLEEIRDIMVEQAGVRRERITLDAELRGNLEID